MSSVVPYTRSLGARPGVQLNPLIDNTELFAAGNDDQKFAVVGRFLRGRIDKAFRVNPGNMMRVLGKSVSPNVNQLAETYVQMYEAFKNGAVEAVVSRLHVASAELKYMVVQGSATGSACWDVNAAADTGTAGAFDSILGIKHLECFNEGVTAEIYAVAAVDGDDNPIASKWVKLRLKDKTSKAVLFSFEGSLDPSAVDEFNQSTYLPNVVSGQTDLVEIEVSVLGLDGVPTTCAFYGKDGSGIEKWVSADLVYFTEGSTTYANTDYDASCAELHDSEHGYGYILGGNKGVDAYVSKLIELGVSINKQVVWDLDGDNAAAAITAYNAVNVDTHYSQVYWAPLLRNDPLNGGKARIGVSGIQVGMRCSRNARTDANGFAPKNYPIAGKDWAITATGIVQYNTPTDLELDDLAEAHINPVLFERYNAGAKYVFTDSLTGAKSNGDRKLIAVAEMSSTVDHYIASFGKECLQLPMLDGIKRMSDFVKKILDAAETAKWIKPSEELGGRSYIATVAPNAARPNDRMDEAHACRYDGTVRAIYVQQTLSK